MRGNFIISVSQSGTNIEFHDCLVLGNEWYLKAILCSAITILTQQTRRQEREKMSV